MTDHPIFAQLIDFCETDVNSFIKNKTHNTPYPKALISRMADMGLFGVNLPEKYGGSKIPALLNIPINRLLSRYWLGLPALYGIHLRSSQYLIAIGTQEQQQTIVPNMAKGQLITTHAYHEKGIRDPHKFSTRLIKSNNHYVLSGTKEWVINVHNANTIVVIAKTDNPDSICNAVLINQGTPGMRIEENYYRRGLHGVSLSRIHFDNVNLSEEHIVGGHSACAFKTATDFQAMPYLNFSARAVGVAESIVDLLKPYLRYSQRESAAKTMIEYRWAEIQMIKESIIAYFEQSVALHKAKKLTESRAYRTKAFCTQTLVKLSNKAGTLCGGSGYAGDNQRLIQQLIDAESLSFIDTPNEILIGLSGACELNTGQ
ncbi:MAG: acyl-CoA dehydrogenase family protein [Pseudomonadota bacterium]